MSTETQQTTLGFAEAPVIKMPRLACIGKVSEVGEGKESSSGMYNVQPIKVRPVGPGKPITIQLLYRPEWLTVGFEPKSILDYGIDEETGKDVGKSMYYVYRMHVNRPGNEERSYGVCHLKGLSGSDEGYAQLVHNLLSTEDKSVFSMQEVMREFFTVTNENMNVGYILQQKTQKTTDPDSGKTVYVLDSGYEIGGWFRVDADSVKRVKLRAERAKDDSFKIAFDPDEF